jgi:hypothetical protein
MILARISVPISDKQFQRIQKIFPWGTQAAVVRRVMDLLCDRIEQEGVVVIELLISGQYNPIEKIKERGKLT